MNLPIPKKELQQPAVTGVLEDRFGVPNRMTNGDNWKAHQPSDAVGHPLKASEDSHMLESVRQELALAKRLCGSQLSYQLATELQACAQVGRLECPVPSSRCMIDTLLGLDDSVTLDGVLKSDPDYY